MKRGYALPPGKGTYILIFNLISDARISVGRLGEFTFARGFYCYVGSAFGNGGLKARLRHHISRSVSPRWHVDYLKMVADLEHIIFSCSGERLEHQWAVSMLNTDGLEAAVEGFGSSDCRCRTHLFCRRNGSLSGLLKMVTERISADDTIIGTI